MTLKGGLFQIGSPAMLGMLYQVDGGYSPRPAWGERNDPCVPSSQETRTKTTPKASIF